MGYSHYFYSIPKVQLDEIRNCKTVDEFCDWAEKRGYKVTRYKCEPPFCSPRNIGKEIYDFGKYVDWAFKIQSKNESIFDSDELKEEYSDYFPVLCSQDDFLFVINEYIQKIVNYYKELLSDDSPIPMEQRHKQHIEYQLDEWENCFGFCPIDTNLSSEKINRSWLYEYAIFELVRVYKTFDWENDTLVLMGS